MDVDEESTMLEDSVTPSKLVYFYESVDPPLVWLRLDVVICHTFV